LPAGNLTVAHMTLAKAVCAKGYAIRSTANGTATEANVVCLAQQWTPGWFLRDGFGARLPPCVPTCSADNDCQAEAKDKAADPSAGCLRGQCSSNKYMQHTLSIL
jgi:hypothetical protein